MSNTSSRPTARCRPHIHAAHLPAPLVANFFAPSPAQAQLSAAGEAHEARRQAAPKQTAHDKLPFRLLMEDSPGQMWSPNGFVNVVKHPKQRRPKPVDDDDY